MALEIFNDQQRLSAARRILHHVADKMDARFSVRLWDGSMVPLGKQVEVNSFISINSPRVFSTLLKSPTLETLVRLYATGRIDFHADDLMTFWDMVRQKQSKDRIRSIDKSVLLRELPIFLFSPSEKLGSSHEYSSDESGVKESHRSNIDYIQFHYDLSNEFYALFLDPEMVYSCGYFKEAGNSLEQAQKDKLDIICRKLRLKSGEKMLDIGSGWGGLICHAARNYGVKAHGVTLSQKQYEYTLAKIKRLGLEGQVTVELKDYMKLEGTFDKIASVGMFEHIGLANIPAYFSKMNSLLRDRGVLLNHAITRRAKPDKKKFLKIRPSMKLLQKYIFPGGAIDHIGHSIESMETSGFEVRDVESLREHYALTTTHWCRRLLARRDEAIKLVGAERYRIWVAYIGGVSFGFTDGYSNIYQTVAIKRSSKGHSGLPMTRQDWYN